MAPLPLINPWQGLATLGFTLYSAHTAQHSGYFRFQRQYTRSDQPLLTLSLTVNLILFYKYFVHLLSLHSLSLQTQFSSACFVKPCKENMSCI